MTIAAETKKTAETGMKQEKGLERGVLVVVWRGCLECAVPGQDRADGGLPERCIYSVRGNWARQTTNLDWVAALQTGYLRCQ